MISGTLIDENDSPISYAEIIISANDSIITSEFTNNEGNFSIDLSKGSYVMIFNYYGNEVLRKKIFVTLFRSSESITNQFHLPVNRVVELGSQVVI